MAKKTVKIDFSQDRLAKLADRAYNEGDFVKALRFAYQELDRFGASAESFMRLADIYEGMNLNDSAITWLYRFLDIALAEDLPDIYESLAVNYLNAGKEAQSAYYYNMLIDSDESISNDMKMEIAQAFSKEKTKKFRFTYPPELADYSKEIERGSLALKAGNCDMAIDLLSRVEKGAKGFERAKETQAVAHLLKGESELAEKSCLEALDSDPENIRALATLSAVYTERGDREKSKEIALALCEKNCTDTEDIYKIATVCCENELHEQAYEKFCQLEKRLQGDGRVLYFKAVSAYYCNKLEESERAFDQLCTIYPDAEVGRFYLLALRAHKENGEELPEFTYFYSLPKAEKEYRAKALIGLGKCDKEEAELLYLVGEYARYLKWCFDEMDGTDHDLQYLALATAVHVRADDFIYEIMLDHEILDALKVETLRMIYERNEEMKIGVVFCHAYRKIRILPVEIGRKRHKRFISAYARIASRFVGLGENYSRRLKNATEKLYQDLTKNDGFECVNNTNDLACAIFFCAGFKELGSDRKSVAIALEADEQKVEEILNAANGVRKQENIENESENKNEID